jgi:hypothetical protein
MSAYVTVQTKITDKNLLLQALADLGCKQVECHEVAQHLYGYQGDLRPERAEVIIRRKHIGDGSNDIGFKQLADGTYEAIISDADRRVYSDKWLGRLLQRCAYHTVKRELEQKRFSIVEETVDRDQRVRLVVRRAV